MNKLPLSKDVRQIGSQHLFELTVYNIKLYFYISTTVVAQAYKNMFSEHQESPIPSTSKSEADLGLQPEMASKYGSPAIVEETEEWGVARPSIELATTAEEVREAYAEADRNWDRLLAYVGSSREEFDNDCEDQNKENDGTDDSGERDWGSNIGIYGDGGDDEDEGEVDRDEDGEKVNSDRARDVNESKGLLGLEQGKEERREKGWLRKLKFWKR